MPYNPNSVWESKEKKYVFAEQGTTEQSSAAPGQTPLNGSGGGPSVPPDSGGGRDFSFFKKHGLVLFAGGIVTAIVLAIVIYVLMLPPTAPNISITFSDTGTVTTGQPFPLTITVSNESKSVLQDANLTITLPNGLSFVGNNTTPDQRALMESVGTLSSQTINPPITVQVVATGDSGSSQTVKASLTYGTANTGSSQFQSNAQTAIAIGLQSAIAVSYSAPSSIFSGQNFDLAVNYANLTGTIMPGVKLVMQYPPAYHFVSSNGRSPLDPANSTWDLGDLAPYATGTVIITGNIVGPTSAQYQLGGTIGATFSGQMYPAIERPANFAITPSPLSFSLMLNNSTSYVSRTGDSLNYTLSYTNNSSVAFQTLNVKASLTGQMYDLTSLKTNGTFSSQNNTITWYTANTPALAAIAPGQSGSVNFTIATKKAFPIKQINNKDYTLNVSAAIQSPTVPPNTAGSSTASVASLSTKVAGELDLAAAGFVKETAVPSIKNSGPYPPKVDQPTTYTIHWTLTNYATDMKNVTVSAYLQSGTTFTGAATSTVGTSLPMYNPATGLVSWTIPSIAATTGVISAPIQAVFQISNTPAVNQIGQAVTIMGASTLTATDAFTNTAVTGTVSPITTQFQSDPSVSGQEGWVVQ